MGGNYSAMDPMEVPVPDLTKLFERDGYLKPYEREIRRRYAFLLYLCYFIFKNRIYQVIASKVFIKFLFELSLRLPQLCLLRAANEAKKRLKTMKHSSGICIRSKRFGY